MTSFSSNYKKRLSQYAGTAAALLAIPVAANADIIYTDVDPDTVMNQNNQEFFIDFNNDATDDLRIALWQFSSGSSTWGTSFLKIYAQGLNGASVWADASTFAKKVPAGSLIESGLKWRAQNSSTYLPLGTGYHFFSASSSTNWTRGPWPGGGDHYLGVKLDINGRTHYAWARMFMKNDGKEITIKDFAWNDQNDLPILAGQTAITPADTIQSVTVADTSDQANGNDLWVAFDTVANENVIDGYRIFVVKSADAATFDLDSANKVPSGSYVDMPKTGNNIGLKLGGGAKDVNAEAITNNVAYKVFAMALADQFNTHVNSLSDPSEEITLTTSAMPATNVIAMDSTDAGNASDIYLTFDPSSNENVCSGYRIIITKAGTSLDLATAENLVAARYQEVSKDGMSQALLLDASLLDADGDAIVNGSDYEAYVLALADQIVATKNALSVASNSFILSSTISIQEDKQEIRVFDYSGNIEMFIPTEITDAHVSLYDINGKLQWTENLNGKHFNRQHEMTKTGIYILSLESSSKTQSWKLFLN